MDSHGSEKIYVSIYEILIISRLIRNNFRKTNVHKICIGAMLGNLQSLIIKYVKM